MPISLNRCILVHMYILKYPIYLPDMFNPSELCMHFRQFSPMSCIWYTQTIKLFPIS